MAKRRKRANNEGSVFQRPNGSWRAQVTLDGKRISKTTSTQKEGLDWVRKTLNQIDQGLSFDNSQITIEEYFSDWLKNIESTLRASTFTQYHQISRDYIVPNLGKIKLCDLKTGQIQNLYHKQQASGLGVRSIRTTHAVLRRALNQAVEFGILSQNPTRLANPPAQKHQEMKYFDQDQVQCFLQTVKDYNDRYLALFQLAITTGMRQGELLGLQWNDLSWERKTLQVQRQLKRKKGGGFIFSSPKTKSGKRTLVLGSKTIELLASHQENLKQDQIVAGDRWNETNLIFPNTIGNPTQPDKLAKRFKRLTKLAGLPEIRFHDLRHTAATLMLNQGVPVLVVSRRLGHAKPSTTLDVYGHLIASMQTEVAELMDTITIL